MGIPDAYLNFFRSFYNVVSQSFTIIQTTVRKSDNFSSDTVSAVFHVFVGHHSLDTTK